MSLPIQIGRVRYKVAGSYAFKGSLIVTKERIYFVPLKQLGKTKPPDFEAAAFGQVVGQFGLLGQIVKAQGTSLDDSITLFSRPTLNLRQIFWEKPSDEALKSILDAHIEALKKHTSYSSDDLPAPSRYSKETVRDLALSFMGMLSFKTEFEDHVFRIGIIRKNKLRQALIESGFMS